MGPFEFIILFFSFIYTLALTHLLFAITRMIRHRRELVFSWPHALWMVSATLFLIANWISNWDFHRLETIRLFEFAGGLVFVILQYFICALVAPDFDDGETFDMQAFHAREGRTYMAAILIAALGAVALNIGAGLDDPELGRTGRSGHRDGTGRPSRAVRQTPLGAGRGTARIRQG